MKVTEIKLLKIKSNHAQLNTVNVTVTVKIMTFIMAFMHETEQKLGISNFIKSCGKTVSCDRNKT